MILWNVTILVLSSVLFCSALHEKDDQKYNMIQNIINKVYNISIESIKYANPNEKRDILNKIEHKLKLSTKQLGDQGDKYVRIIMHGIKALMPNNSNIKDIRRNAENQIGDLKNSLKYNVTTVNQANKRVVDAIARKIMSITNIHSENIKTRQNQIAIMQQIQQKVKEIAQKDKSLSHSVRNKTKIYADILTRGMKNMFKKIAQNKTIAKALQLRNYINETPKVYKGIKKQSTEVIVANGGMGTTLTYKVNYASTPFISCEKTVSETCDDIKSLQRYQCSRNTLPLYKICDGVVHCLDGSDEKNCLNHAMERIQRSTRIISHLETYMLKNCFLSSDNTVVVRQKELFDNVLQKQRNFLGKYTGFNVIEQINDNKLIKTTVNEIVVIIEAVAIALDSSLCMNEIPNRNKVDVNSQLFSLGEHVVELKVPVEKCSCSKSFCSDIYCSDSCKLICWFKYTLTRWRCHAVDESTSISLNNICDGKLDCYDESDEMGCDAGASINKFEANKIYDKILKLVRTKSRSKEYLIVSGKLMLFYNAVKLLQNTTLSPNIDVMNVKNVRDECFSALLAIYEEIIKSSYFMGDLEEAQLFLQSINEKLVLALKHSNVGNNKIPPPRDGCICRKNQCIAANCPKNCQKACSVRSKFTKYWCKGTSNNMTIPLEWVCNERPDCPFEDDEAQCERETCRKHHLLILKKNLRDVGRNKKLTSLGETLKDWSAKVIHNLETAKAEYRPTPTTFRDIIIDILNDLVMTYASIDDYTLYRRNKNDTYFEDFLKISQKIIRNLKICNR